MNFFPGLCHFLFGRDIIKKIWQCKHYHLVMFPFADSCGSTCAFMSPVLRGVNCTPHLLLIIYFDAKMVQAKKKIPSVNNKVMTFCRVKHIDLWVLCLKYGFINLTIFSQ
jgi:hypothetical protein